LLTGAAGAQTIGIVTTPAGSFSNSARAGDRQSARREGETPGHRPGTGKHGIRGSGKRLGGFQRVELVRRDVLFDRHRRIRGPGRQAAMRYVGSLIPYRVAMHVRADSRSIRSPISKASASPASSTRRRQSHGSLRRTSRTWARLRRRGEDPGAERGSAGGDFMSGKVDVLFFAWAPRPSSRRTRASEDCASSKSALRPTR